MPTWLKPRKKCLASLPVQDADPPAICAGEPLQVPQPGATSVPQNLIRKLVAQTYTKKAPALRTDRITASQSGSDAEVLLDEEVDGVRCLLLKPSQHGARFHLSPRELEIVRMITKGHPNKTIAAVLEISVWTVQTHLRRIYAKLSVNSRTEMVARTMENGFLHTQAPSRQSVVPG